MLNLADSGVSLGIRLEAPSDLILLDLPVTASYRTHEDGQFVTLPGPYNENGSVFVPDGTISDTYYFWFDGSFEGIPFDEIELRIETSDRRFIVKWAAMYFMKVLSGNLAWNANLDLGNTMELETDESQAALLDDLITSGRIVSLVHQRTTYRVRVSSWLGADSTGRSDHRSTRTVALLQIRDRP